MGLLRLCNITIFLLIIIVLSVSLTAAAGPQNYLVGDYCSNFTYLSEIVDCYNVSYNKYVLEGNVTGQMQELFNVGNAYQLYDVDNISYVLIASQYYYSALLICGKNNCPYPVHIHHSYTLSLIKLESYTSAKKNIDFHKKVLLEEFGVDCENSACNNQARDAFNRYYEENIEYYYSLKNITQTSYFLDKYFSNTQSTDFYYDRALDISLDIQTILEEKFFEENSANITFDITMDIYDYSESYYLVNVSIFMRNDNDFDIIFPIIQYSLVNFENIHNYTDSEENCGTWGMTLFDRVLTSEEINEIQENGVLLNKELNQTRIVNFPNRGCDLNAHDSSTFHAQFIILKNLLLTRLGTRTTLLYDAKVNYTKEINLFVDDVFRSQIPFELSFSNNSYNMQWSRILSESNSEYKKTTTYLDTPSEIGFVFGIAKPSTRMLEFHEDIYVDNKFAQLMRSELRDITDDSVDADINSLLFYPDKNTHNIQWSLETKTGSIVKEPESEKSRLGEENFSVEYYSPFFTSEDNNRRTLTFRVPPFENTTKFKYGYTLNISRFVIQKNFYTFVFNYDILYLPGEFGHNIYNYNFYFKDPYIVTSHSELSGCDSGKKFSVITKMSEVNYNCESTKFKAFDNVSIVYKDKNLENLFWIIVIIMSALTLIFISFNPRKYGLSPNNSSNKPYYEIVSIIFTAILSSFVLPTYWKFIVFLIVSLVSICLLLNRHNHKRQYL